MKKRNTEPLMATYLHAKGNKLGLPVGGTFELTARCNFNCPMCYIHQSGDECKKDKELSAAEWIKIAKDASDRGMVFLLLTGGEPFVRKDFFEIYDAAKAMGLMISINSNGYLIKGEILEKLKENPPFRINISLYGGCRETYKKMCGVDGFDTVIENIRALKEAGIDVRLNLSVTPYNQDDLEKIFEISKKLGVHIKGNTYMYPPVRAKNQYGTGNRFSAEEAAMQSARWDKIRLSDEEYKRRVLSLAEFTLEQANDCDIDASEGIRCRAGRSSFWLTYDGRLMPCGMFPFPQVSVPEKGFNEAWEQIKAQTAEILLPSKCNSCKKRKACAVCAAVCVTETGSFSEVPEYMCRFTDTLTDFARKEMDDYAD